MQKKLLLLMLAFVVLLANAGVKVHTLGDSLSEGKAAESEQQGWPSFLASFLNGIDVVNPAKSGTSTKSFYNGYWPAAKANVSNGDYVIVQFSHNDENNSGVDADEYNLYLTQEGQTTSTDIRGTSPTTMRAYLKKYIEDIKALGATPILSSAICRFWFTSDKVRRSGRHDLGDSFSSLTQDSDGKWVYTTGNSVPENDHSMDLSQIIKDVAAEENVPFIDMTTASKDLFEKYGEATSKSLMGVSTDGTHTNATGAYMMAKEVAKLLKAANLTGLSENVVIPTEASANPSSFSLGELYTGVASVSQTLLTGDGLSPEAGNATITAGDNLEVSLDGTTYAKTQTVSYTDGTLFQKVFIKATYSAEGTDVTNNVTVEVGGKTITIPVKASPISLAGGSDVSAYWNLQANTSLTSATGLTATDMTFSNMEVNGYKLVADTYTNKCCRVQNTGMTGTTSQGVETTNGVWESTIDVVENRYVDFAVTAPSTMDVKISNISAVIAGTGTGSLRCRMRLGDGTTFGDAVYDNTSGLTANTEIELNLTPVYTIKAGKTMHLRMWPWANANVTQKYFCIRDLKIEGKAFEASADPEPTPDPTTVYTFGIGRNIETAATETAANVLASGQEVIKGSYPEGVAVAQTTTCDYANSNATLYHGSKDLADTYTAANAWRNMLNKVAVNAAYNEGFYGGFSVTVPEGQVMNVSQIFGDFVAQKNNYSYKFEVVKDGTTLYESTAKAASNIQSCGTGNVATTLNTSSIEDLQGLKGIIEFRMPWWIASTAASGAILDFNINATFAAAAADTETPAFTTQPTATSEVMVGKPVDLAVEAEHYSTLTWYQAASTTPAPETDTQLGTGKTYSFTSTTAGTYYIYCRAYNEDATGEQYTNSNVATITVKDVVYPLTVTWDFNSTTDQDYFTNQFAYQKNTGSVHSNVYNFDLAVDATNGKFSTQGRSSLAQFNTGTILRVPVGSTNDVVKLTLYNGAQATLGGELVTTSNEFTHKVFKAEAEQGYVEIVSTTGGYLAKIEAVLQGDGARDDRNATVTYYDVDGTTVLGTQTVLAGETIGTYQYSANIPEGYTDNGWVNAVALAVATTDVVAADMVIYPYVTKVENGKYIIPAGNGRQLYNTLRNAATDSKFYLANGTYDLGTLCRTELKSGFVLLGESTDGVKVVNHPTAPGIQATSTFRITGDNVYIQKMTLRCDVSYPTSSTHGVGVALEINGDKSICNKVNLECNQDTYYSNGSATQVGYFKKGKIEGTVDFICGGGNMWFEGTQLYCNQRYDASKGQSTTNGDVIGAPSTAVATTYGYVLSNCTIDGADCQANNYSLARGWQNSPAMTWLNTTFNKIPSAQGYTTMSSGLVCRFHEYNNGNSVAGHSLTSPKNLNYSSSSDPIYITADEAAKYTYENVLGGWDPEETIKIYDPDEATGIDNVNAAKYLSSDKIYNLSGQQVGASYKGVVIINGKKVRK